MTETQAPAQHSSHRALLAVGGIPREQPAVTLDAIIVPNGRNSAYLRNAVEAARHTGARLVLFCSIGARARHAVRTAELAGVEAVAFDTTRLPKSQLVPAFAADHLLGGDRFHRPTDTSFKRNLGLLLANMTGWQRILFLDDDITLPKPDDLFEAAALLGKYSTVGLANTGMPDNSVVCHAFRDSGGDQDTFIGGGALAVGRKSFRSFFPNIYNEDWFFLLDETGLRPSAMTGTAFQSEYDPFRDTRRARAEELGDTLAEGIFGLLDNKLKPKDATLDYWRVFLADRRRFISCVLDRVAASSLEPAKRARMIDSLKAANGRSQLITPRLCVDYLRLWQADGVRWRRHLDALAAEHGTNLELEVAVKALGIWRQAKWSQL